MRKRSIATAVLLVEVLAIGLSFSPAAAIGGCSAGTAVALSPAQLTCSYVASGPGGYEATTANPWLISVMRGSVRVQQIQGGIWNIDTLLTPLSGSIASEAGDTVILRLYAVCTTPQSLLCAKAGSLSAADSA